MDFTSNMNINSNKPSLPKSRSNASFSQAAVTKSDVGDFQEGYFVMAEMPSLPQRNKTHKTPERNQRKNEHSNYRQQQPRERSTKDLDQLAQRESDPNVSSGRITSPTRSPTRNNKRISNSHSPQRPHQTTYTEPTNVLPLSPYKPHKAHSQSHISFEKRVERTMSSPLFSTELGSSPPKHPQEKGPSPPPDRWAGPAFSKAPPPSSLPIPDFPPFHPSQSQTPSVLSSSPLTSPPISAPLPVPFVVPQQPVMMYHEPPQYFQPPVYSPVMYHGHHMVHDPQPSLAELSTDLRRMLNIGGQPLGQPLLAQPIRA